jgi:hypothetical protein
LPLKPDPLEAVSLAACSHDSKRVAIAQTRQKLVYLQAAVDSGSSLELRAVPSEVLPLISLGAGFIGQFT